MIKERRKSLRIRNLNPKVKSEIRLVARRMRQTLVEVMGEKQGTDYYTMDWLVQRVKWHLAKAPNQARIFLAEKNGKIVGHAIARIERGKQGVKFGYFSTIFVESGMRRRGVAKALMNEVESWLIETKLRRVVYNTALDHKAILPLFKKSGYRIVLKTKTMVQLSKPLRRGSTTSSAKRPK